MHSRAPVTSFRIATWRPLSRYLGPWVPEPQLWQDPFPTVDHTLIGPGDVTTLKDQILASGLSVSQLVSVAWRSAASFRGTDKRGGAMGHVEMSVARASTP